VTAPSVEAAREEANAAVQAADAARGGPPPTAPFARPAPKVALVMALVAAIILITLLLPSTGASAKYTDVHEITAQPADFYGKTVAVVGGVQSGSVSVGSKMAFNLTDYSDETKWIRVVYDGGQPVAFDEGKQVLVKGVVTETPDGIRLVVEQGGISVGCPTDYRGAVQP
jgi:cytochrome c-type biogenesis protein CcmE